MNQTGGRRRHSVVSVDAHFCSWTAFHVPNHVFNFSLRKNPKFDVCQSLDALFGFDLGDSSGYAYYSGARFAVYVDGASDAIARGGRYDEVGAIFGRTRPAVGFGLDVKELVELVPAKAPRRAVRAPWSDDAALRSTVRQLRRRGEIVVRQFSGAGDDEGGLVFDRSLSATSGQWSLQDGSGA